MQNNEDICILVFRTLIHLWFYFMLIISDDPLAKRLRIRRFKTSKRMRLRIDEKGILLTAPVWISDKEIHCFFMEHRDWVEKQLMLMDEKMSVFSLRTDGEQRFFLVEGTWNLVEERDQSVDWVQIRYENNKLVVLYPSLLRSRGDLEIRLKEWIKEQTIQKSKDFIELNKDRIVVLPNRIRISSAKSKWGSCTSKGVVSLHYRLFQLPPLALQYVLCHELAHLVHMNHGSLFWEEVRRLMPNYKEGNEKLLQRDFPRNGSL
ncbi:MAG: hypothetical protein CL916_03395 [Deltaproteobacteria bacterium]|nr:hypothetical protein [Deltaproteobacteria bacterium]